MSILVRVDPRYPGAWDNLVPYIQSALYNGGGIVDWKAEDVYRAAVEGTVELWALVHDDIIFGALVTCSTTYPQRKVLEILVLATDTQTETQWFQMFDGFKQMAKAGGFDAIIGTGRPGWAKKLNALERRVFEVIL